MQKDPIVEECNGCGRTVVGPEPGTACCRVYPMPGAQWRGIRKCPMATHLKKEVKEDTFKLNPLKASKRSMGK